jgi:hypothetical protein
MAGEFTENLAPVRVNGLYGYIDTHNKFIIPPQFDYAMCFEQGIAFVWKNGIKYAINHRGELLFNHPYRTILCADENCDYFFVQTHNNCMGIVDRNGQLKIDTLYNMAYAFNEGIGIMIDSSANGISFAAIDTTGRTIVGFNKYEYISQFKFGRAVARLIGDYKSFSIIDADGTECVKLPLDSRPQSVFSDEGIMWLSTQHGFLPIDLDGNTIFNPKSHIINATPYKNGKSIVTYYSEKSYEIDVKGMHLKPINFKQDENSSTLFSKTDGLGFKNGLLTVQDTLYAYVNKKNEYIWREKKQTQFFQTFDVDYKITANYAADCYTCLNNAFSRVIPPKQKRKLPVNSITIVVKDNKCLPYDQYREGNIVHIANTTNDTIACTWTSNVINLTLQALDKNGVWKDIETMPTGGCLVKTKLLLPQNYWQFAVPIFKGSYKTKLRMKLNYHIDADEHWFFRPKSIFVAYSNIFEGFINPAQLWRHKSDCYFLYAINGFDRLQCYNEYNNIKDNIIYQLYMLQY